jgi:UDP-2-acetamido-2,6-beta-L-arabino-hexul-4-ose reductase
MLNEIIMINILVTGSKGFVGKNLLESLSRMDGVNILTFDKGESMDSLRSQLKIADFIYHFAGVNRSERIEDFEEVNVGLTQNIINILELQRKNTPIAMSSSIQAKLNNVYGLSKKKAELILKEYGLKNNASIFIFSLPNIFGKWSKPNHNSVVATFCYNISHGLDIQISDKNKEIELVYIDTVVKKFTDLLDRDVNITQKDYTFKPQFKLSLGDLAERIYQLRDIRKTSIIPDMSEELMRCLNATYLSFLDTTDFAYRLGIIEDQRGFLVELLKSKYFGQIFISKTKKGIVRGNHYHNSKIEKFMLVQGEAVIKFRNIFNDAVFSYPVSDRDIKVVDIPPGYTHSIENVGESEMIVLFWANEIFNVTNPDTYYKQL